MSLQKSMGFGWVVIFFITVIAASWSNATEAGGTLEIGPMLGIAHDVGAAASGTSLGGLVTVSWPHLEGIAFEVSAAYIRFEDENDDGHVSFSSLSAGTRVSIFDRGAVRLFGMAALGLYSKAKSFSTQARSRNSLLPSTQMDGAPGLSLGTGISWRPFGGNFTLVSTQRFHSVHTDVRSSHFLVISLGMGLELP